MTFKISDDARDLSPPGHRPITTRSLPVANSLICLQTKHIMYFLDDYYHITHNIFVINLGAECKLQLKMQASVDSAGAGME